MDSNQKNDKTIASLQLKEEQFSIVKKWIETGTVEIYKETTTLDKTINVPIVQEQLVIQIKNSQSTNLNMENENSQTIKIPLKEERIEIIKHPVELEKVEIFKRNFIETKVLDVTLKKENLKVDTTGKVVVKKIK